METLDVNLCEFRQICILFGCDYLPREIKEKHSYMTIFNIYKMFIKYKEYNKQYQINDNDNDNDIDELSNKISNNKYKFYDWLIIEKKDLSPYINEASKIIDLFDISYYNNLELYDNIKIMNGPIDKSRLMEIMQTENFIFPNTISSNSSN